ncbi:MAG TPA: restriction endonuclease subunit S [Cellvibrio sp.]|nr:restriction endonuclease subunit S [Cellvibrio sp.]
MQNLITKHLDIWTAAHKTRSTAGRGSSNKLDLYGIKKLRELILELAVRGKLVPQDPNDEPASVLLRRIAEEEIFIKGKFKSEKLFAEITNDDKRFELPMGWEWSKLGLIGETNIGLTYKPSNVTDNGIPVLRSSNIQFGKIDLTDLVRVSGLEIKESARVHKGDLLICVRNGSKALVGKTAQIKDLPEPMSFGAFMAIFRSSLNSYIEIFLNSPVFRKNLDGTDTTTINQITQGNLIETLVSIPPLLEQHRIVAKVDELMAFCDQLEQTQSDNITAHAQLVEALLASLTNSADHKELQTNWQRIAAHFDTLFTTEHSIDQLKQTILQLAVMGKLVPQNPKDEPASELLKKIAAEKAQLIKEGKIKKEKPLPEITDEEKFFELPRGWVWTRVGALINLVSGQHLNPSEYSDSYQEGMLDYLTGPADFGDTQPNATRYTFETRAISKVGDILITCKGSGVGKLNRSDKSYAISRQLMSIQPIIIDVNYTYLLMDSLNTQIRSQIVGIAIPGISREDVTNSIAMVPPLAEQHRIVSKVNELMTFCNFLKTNLQNSQVVQYALADALIDSILGPKNVIAKQSMQENIVNITTSLKLSSHKVPSDKALLAKIIKGEGGDADAKQVWKKSSLDLPSFYKQLKIEIAEGYIKKPSAGITV